MTALPKYNYAFFTCSNGLGHLRRCIAIAKMLGNSVILTKTVNVERLRPTVNVDGIDFIEWYSGVTAESLRAGDVHLANVPKVDARIVISDNLPDILEHYPDAILQGSFLWHDVIPGADTRYVERSMELLVKHRPVMIGLDLFAMPAVRQLTRFYPVGLYRYCEPMDVPKTNILISGRGREMSLLLKPILHSAVNNNGIVFVDQSLLPTSFPDWIKPATYDCHMFASLSHAIGRPGLGTVCQVLTAGGKFYPVYEPDNLEMLHNAKRLYELTYETAVDFGLDGICQTADYLRSLL